MSNKARAKVGDVVRVVFLDHTENMQGPSRCECYGVVTDVGRQHYQVCGWRPLDALDEEDLKRNATTWCVLKKVIEELAILTQG